MSYDPTLILDLAETVLTFQNDNLHWAYVVVTVTIDEETEEQTESAVIEASENHIDPMQYWESDAKIYYKIGYFGPVVGGKREAHLLWNNVKGGTGVNGKQIELSTSGGYVVWRYVGDTEWINLVALSTLTGTNGKSVELSTSGGYIVWRLVGDTSWINLVLLSSLKGDKGDPGSQPLQITGIILTAASWSLLSGLYEYNLANANITANSIVDVIPANASIAIVKAAEVLPETDSSAGSVKLYATNAPTGDISITINITEKQV